MRLARSFLVLAVVIPLLWLQAMPLAGQPGPKDVFIHSAFVDVDSAPPHRYDQRWELRREWRECVGHA